MVEFRYSTRHDPFGGLDAFYFREWMQVYECCRRSARALFIRDGRIKTLESTWPCPECGLVWSPPENPFDVFPPWCSPAEMPCWYSP